MPAHLLIPSYVDTLTELLCHGNRTPVQLARRSGIPRRMVERTLGLMRRAGMVRTLTRPTSYELTDNCLPATAANGDRQFAEINLPSDIGFGLGNYNDKTGGTL